MSRRGGKARRRPASTAPVPISLPRGAWLCALGVFAAVFAVYLLTIIPTVVDQDSGELVAVAHGLGVAHPTGYPLWTLLARAFDLLPVGHTSAYRVALVSAVSAAGAAALVCWLTISLTGVLLPGVFAGIAFGLWFPTWSQAVLAEVYALEALLFALFLVALWRWERDRSPRGLQWLALAGGFAAMHHRTAFLALAPSLAGAWWLTMPRRAKVWVASGLLFLAPFLLYLYLPLRAAARPPMNWGNPDTAERFLAHVLGRQYSRWAFANSFEVMMEQGGRLLGEALAGAGWLSWALALVGAPLIVWGLVWWYRRQRFVVGSVVAGSALLSVWVLAWGDTSDSKVWLTPVGAVMAVLFGAGLARASARFAPRRYGPWVSAALGAMVCLALLAANWERSDRSDQWRHRDRWAAALSQMDKKALFVAEDDVPMFATYYLQQVEGLRQDVVQVRPHGLWQSWYVDLIPEAELRGTAPELWGPIAAELNLQHPGTPEFWQATARFAHRLAQHYRGRRTVYALHGPTGTSIPGPPYFVGVNADLWRLDFERPNPLRAAEAEQPLARMPNGVDLMSLSFEPQDPRPGEMVEFRACWRLDRPLSGTLFALRLRPAGEDGAARGDQWDRFAAQGEYVQGFPLIYGLWGLAASPPGTVYEQTGKLIVASNAPEGGYRLALGVAYSHPPKYQGWTELGEEAWLMVGAGPLPTNGP